MKVTKRPQSRCGNPVEMFTAPLSFSFVSTLAKEDPESPRGGKNVGFVDARTSWKNLDSPPLWKRSIVCKSFTDENLLVFKTPKSPISKGRTLGHNLSFSLRGLVVVTGETNNKAVYSLFPSSPDYILLLLRHLLNENSYILGRMRYSGFFL